MSDRSRTPHNRSRRRDCTRRSRSRSRRQSHDRRSRRHDHDRRSRNRTQTPPPVSRGRDPVVMQQTLHSILTRLNALENNNSFLTNSANNECMDQSRSAIRSNQNPSETTDARVVRTRRNLHDIDITNCNNESAPPNELSTPSLHTSEILLTPQIIHNASPQHNRESKMSESTRLLAEAIRSLNSSRSQNYFVSNFDPAMHDIEAWCEEVERARLANNWQDSECLSRVSNCLRGDARTWLNEWVTSDRTWSNFVREFKPLCPRKLDYANILYEAMNTTSDKFTSYSEYARRTLLRLRIVKGLSAELMVLIVIRGITDPQVRAAAANANLTTEDIVSFLSIYAKPVRSKQEFRPMQNRKRTLPNPAYSNMKCFGCGRIGHKHVDCLAKGRSSSQSFKRPASSLETGTSSQMNSNVCSFCKKPGHSEDVCFAKERSQPRNKRNVNLCTEPTDSYRNSDITTAVIQGVPVDVLIDSGALNISLVSADVLKHFSCERQPIKCTLKGISDNIVEADSFVSLTIEFEGLSIEADFIVVPGSCINFPIIVGTDILNREGVTYVRTKDRQYLTRTLVNTISHVNTVAADESITVNTPLEGEQRKSVLKVVSDFSKFFISGTATTTVKTGKMSINVTDNTPVAYRPYRLSYNEKHKVRQIIKDLKDNGIVRESNSEYASPIILVKKKDGSDRMCVDYRALNRLTVRDRYPLPLIDDHVDRLGSFKYFSSLDMATGFHQIPLDEQSIHKTAFVTPEGHFEYLRMPYGLTNSPIVYQRIINDTLRKHIEVGNVLVYVDDVLIMSKTIDEGIQTLREVLKTLTEAGFSINLRKCTFLAMEVEYLGRLVSQGQVRPSPKKVEALVNAPVPSNVKQVRQFLGLAGYFRRYIEGYSTKTACISRLTKKDVKFCWGSEQERVRNEIVARLTSEPILSIFNPLLATELHTDASSIGLGAVLMQTRADGFKHVIGYFSKTTQGAESRYHSYELETLAVVRALQHFRHYLIGLTFKIVTDCNALKATEKKKDLLPRVARWWIYLQDFSFSIEYRKGIMMSHADYLSRNPSTRVYQITKPRTWAQIAQSADSETQGLIQKVRDGELDSKRYVQINDILYYRYECVGKESKLLCFIPKGHRLSLLRVFHDEHEHIGTDKTVDLILKHFWFPGLRHFVAKYISHCLVCISKKRVPRAPHQPISSWEKPNSPFETLHLDALGPLPESEGYKFVLLIVDAFTKFCLLYPILRQDANELKRTFNNAISLFGVPKLIITDRGRMFESSQFRSFVSEIGSDIHYITPEMHNSNGQVERYVRTVLNMIRIEANHRGASWAEQVWKLQLVINMTKQKTTQASPINLLVGIDVATPLIRSLIRDVAVENHQNREAWRETCRTKASELIEKNQVQQDTRVNQKRRAPRKFCPNDLVFVIKYSQATGKLDPGMRGPYRVLKCLPSDRYELRLLSGSYGKTTQAAAQYMVPWRGEWCPDSCAAFFERTIPNRSNRLEDIYLRFFNGSTPEDYVEFPLSEATRLFDIKGFDKNSPTVLYIHGFIETAQQESIQVVVSSYLETRPDTNVVLLDWSNMSHGSYLVNAARNTKKVGAAAAEAIKALVEGGLQLGKIHIIGHSLGSHVAGYTARDLQTRHQKTIKRLTALDPAFPAFYPDGVMMEHINANDAEFVDVIHTDAGGYGAPVRTGTVDFWPNGGRRVQPGCPRFAPMPLSDDNLCSHWRSWRFYAESVRHPEAFPASPADSFHRFRDNPTPELGMIYMGYHCDTSSKGNFYLTTNSASPFGKGIEGLYPKSKKKQMQNSS